MAMPVISAYDFKNYDEEIFSDDSPMKTFYRDKVVLVTGGTGDLGQVYVEKLLRCNTKRIYLLFRTSTDDNNTTAEDRLQEILDSALFSVIRKSEPRFIDRIQPIVCDLSALQLGLSTADRALLTANVQLIVHAGFETNFGTSLHRAALTNVRGTRELLHLAADCTGLLGFAHVSSVFSQQPQMLCGSDAELPVEERFYRTSVDPHWLVALLEANDKLEERTLDVLTGHLIRPWTNAYAFTMALAERLVQEASSLQSAQNKSATTPSPGPTFVVVRAGVVLSTFEDPVAGYTSSANGLNELLIAVSTGAMRVLPRCDAAVTAPVCTSEFVVNATLSALQHARDERPTDRTTDALVVNASAMPTEPKWGQLFGAIVEHVREKPILRSVWRPQAHLMRCRGQVWWFVILYELLPALLADAALSVVGCPARLMPRMRRNVEMRREYALVMGTKWRVDGNRVVELHESLDKSDRAFFPFDLTVVTFDWSDYSYKHALGLKRYVLGENLNDREEAEKRQKKYRLAHGGVLIVYYAAVVFVYSMLFWALGGCAVSKRFVATVW